MRSTLLSFVSLSWCGLLALSACDHQAIAGPSLTAGTALHASTVVTPAAPVIEPRSPAGLEKALAEFDRLVLANASAAAMTEARRAVDHMAGQRDAHLSRLYWHTDLEEAKAEAKRTNRPILSLRLLGRLDEELSCANSRLFRIILYSNEGTSKFLRDNYVLHWSSERPAPQVTLDFGDGRVVKRTITGNSAHYVLDSQGRVVDALPGLYAPARFERTLRETIDLAKRSGELPEAEFAQAISKHHLHMFWALTATWRKQLTKAYGDTYGEYVEKASLPSPARFSYNALYESLPAAAVNALTYSKADLEAPTLSLLQPNVTVGEDFGAWSKIGLGIPAEHLDARSRSLLAEKHPRDWSLADAPALDEAQLTKLLAHYEQRLSEESFRNEMMLHGALHQRMSKSTADLDFTSINDFVYAKLFMSPKTDGWLGLTPGGAMTAIADDGLLTTK